MCCVDARVIQGCSSANLSLGLNLSHRLPAARVDLGCVWGGAVSGNRGFYLG